MNKIEDCAAFGYAEWNARTARELFDMNRDGILLVPGEIENSRKYRTFINRALRMGLIRKKGKSILVCYCKDYCGHKVVRYVLTDNEAFHYLMTGELPDFKECDHVYGIYIMNRYATNYNSYNEFKQAYLAKMAELF